ncbi:MAG TPA: fatty acid desaturase, partial [Isosphaeraceae bacterium]|nr:fatty acid desaturase [Isosphaeraceae bacterium]
PVAMARRIHIEHHRNYIDESLAPTYTYDYWGLNATNWNDRRRLLWIWWFRPLTGYQTWKFLCFRFADLATSVRYPIRCLAFWGIVVGIFSRFAALHLLLYWFVPLLLIHPVLFFWQDMAQHFNVKKSPTRDVRGAVYRLIFNPHGRGAYHNVHHLHAAIPWFNLRRASEFLIDDATVDIAHGFLDLSRQITSVRPEALLRANASNPRL